jgi:PAS domain S-box-containing protein
VKERVSVGLWMALAILGLVALLTYRSIDSAAETLQWVEHTHDVLRQLDAVQAAYSRAAAARRAYVVAGDESQLGETPALDEHVASALVEFRRLLGDNPKQVARADEFAELIHARIGDLNAEIERRRLEGQGRETPAGLALTARIRTIREGMEQEENTLLADRDARTRDDMMRTKVAEVVGTCVSFAILLFAFQQLRREIARRRSSEEALRASEAATVRANQFLDSIVENLPNMVFVKEASELRFERINRAGEDLLGVGRQELLGKNDYDFFPRAQADFFRDRDRETLGKGVVVDVAEEPIQGKEGKRWLHTKKVPILDPRGVPKYLLGISEDITERRLAQEALRVAKEEAEAANRELETFSYSVAHDLRAPLRGIAGFSQALVEDCSDKLDQEGLRYLQRVMGSAKAMGELIDGLLALSRITRGDLLREKVDLTAIARSIGARLKEENPQRKVDIEVQDGLLAQGDRRLLTAALENLIQNAFKFTRDRPKAKIEVGREIKEGKPAFFVRDDGVGFEMAYAEKLFGAFQRLHSTKEFEGTGIGLATVQRIVRRHGGRIWAEGQVDAGATFHFTIASAVGGDENGEQNHSIG